MDFRRYVREHLPALRVVREEEIVEELSQHLEDLYRDAVASGLEHDAAWARATAALPQAAEDLAAALRVASRSPASRAADALRAHLDEPPRQFGGSMVTGFRRDLRYALRTMARESSFTAVVVITLALGIGGTAVIYSAIDAILLRKPPIADFDRVVSVYMLRAARATTNPAAGNQVGTTSYPDYVDLRDSNVLGGLAAFTSVEVTSISTPSRSEFPASWLRAISSTSLVCRRQSAAHSVRMTTASARLFASPSSHTAPGNVASAATRVSSAVRSP